MVLQIRLCRYGVRETSAGRRAGDSVTVTLSQEKKGPRGFSPSLFR